ncbi:class I SAM-dependent methyltransferase [Desulforhabdus amnigena]|uniref:Uncharacterized protein n=1 Tax=Desulforhabdus amnigena TaxID=40218 RepID=A0A9W6L875_9BACT|nr:class I SAM-dependent methyltransferase [Desulforhabdus amnigena]NLJ28484.1 class I SAM-dependent methyltransferase [Deltaproteobacteria bacterium]GLI35368.1 hypothetical protein DAMNIGENAA_28010 [Desulforhabdus amnigena]
MESNPLFKTLSFIADFYDRCKFGCEGVEGYRKSTDMRKCIHFILELEKSGFLDNRRTSFLDLGCADGRVNVMMSYMVRKSIGIEIDPDILSEYAPMKEKLTLQLQEAGLIPPPENISVFQGSSLEEQTYRQVFEKTGVSFQEIDFFYTYITLHDLFGELIAEKAKPGALYMVYGFSKVLPRYEGLERVLSDVGSQGIAALYRKK